MTDKTEKKEWAPLPNRESKKESDKSKNKATSKDKTKDWALLWNVKEQRVESLHESEDDATRAGHSFLAHSGTAAPLTDLAVIGFEAPLPEPPVEVKAVAALAKKRADEDDDGSGKRDAARAKEDADLAEKVQKAEADRKTSHLPDLPKRNDREESDPNADDYYPRSRAEGSDK